MKKKLLLLLALVAISVSGTAQTVSLVGGWQGWNLGTGVPFTTTDNVHFTLSNYTIPATALKFVMNSSWNSAYGYTTAPGFPTDVASIPGTDINVPAGTYNITFNATTKDYAFTAGVNPNAVITISGTGVANTATMSTADGINYKSESLTLNGGTILFSQSNTTNTYGGGTFPSGTATLGGSGIATPAGGTYNVTFNLTTKAYGFTPTVLSMIGIGSPSGSWDIDAPMTSTDGIHYTINGATIAGGGMKFRENGKWEKQFGAPGAPENTPFPSGTAVQNGGDMNTVAGTYDILFNRQTLEYNFVTLGLNDLNKTTFRAFPNPTSNTWNFSATNDVIENIQVMDITGKTILSVKNNANDVAIDASQLPQGLYFAKVSSANATQTIKVIRN